MDIISYAAAVAAAKKYVKETLDGCGSLKGANCTIKSIKPTADANIVTFEWENKDGSSETAEMAVPNGEKGEKGDKGDKGSQGVKGDKGDTGEKAPTITNISINSDNKPIFTFSDGTTIACDVAMPATKMSWGNIDGTIANQTDLINLIDKKYTKVSTGIPKTDLASAVQTSLKKADTALQAESDPTVPSWAKQPTKPTYTASEVGALPAGTTYGTYTKPDGGIPESDLSAEVKNELALAASALQVESDPTVPSWAKQSSKPTYTKSEVGLGNVGNYKAVAVSSQSLTAIEKAQARINIGAGTSSFDGNYNSLSNKPTIPPDVSSNVTELESDATLTLSPENWQGGYLASDSGKYFSSDTKQIVSMYNRISACKKIVTTVPNTIKAKIMFYAIKDGKCLATAYNHYTGTHEWVAPVGTEFYSITVASVDGATLLDVDTINSQITVKSIVSAAVLSKDVSNMKEKIESMKTVWTGTQDEYNLLGTTDEYDLYFVTGGGDVIIYTKNGRR